jgi:hypothetical protein
MEHPQSIFINNIVHDFNVVDITVKADKQMLAAYVRIINTFAKLFVIQDIIVVPYRYAPSEYQP